jgi:6-phospho-3-hexuloisomerase
MIFLYPTALFGDSMSTAPLAKMTDQALGELRDVLHATTAEAVDPLIKEILKAKRICLYGVGREGLMMKAFAMRLFHLGLDAHVVGDMTTPPVSTGDVLIVSAGPGAFSTVLGLMRVAKTDKARTVVITAQRKGKATKQADVVIHLPAQTMANDTKGTTSVLPMGTLFEATQLLFFEFIVIMLRDKLKQKPSEMRSKHTNLE